MSGKYDLHFYLIPRMKIKEYTAKLFSPYSRTKLDRKSRGAGQALGLQVAWKLEFGATHVFGEKSAGLRARSPEFWIGSHVVM